MDEIAGKLLEENVSESYVTARRRGDKNSKQVNFTSYT